MKALWLNSALLLFAGCESAYYGTLETFGVEKRDIIVDRVEEAQQAQEETKETFADALEAFRAVVDVEGGELEAVYDRLKDELASAESRARSLNGRIDAVEDVADDLFREWQDELEAYTSESLRRSSERLLRDTRRSYDSLIRAMRRAESKVDPVLDAFRDQVRFLKHNLNARAIASLQPELERVEEDVAELIAEMEAAIAEARAFIAGMNP